MERGGWIIYWLLGLAGIGFLLASFHVVPPFIFALDDWSLNACLAIGYFGLFFGNLTLRASDSESKRLFTVRRMLMSLGCGIVAALVTFIYWQFVSFPNPSSATYAAVTAGGFALLSFFVGVLGFPVPAPVVLKFKERFVKQ